MRKIRTPGAILALAATLALGGCVVSAWVPGEPPAPYVEAQVVAPGPGYVWIGGWWEWHNRWAWRNGYWAVPPHPRATWVAGRWDRGPRGWRWRPGRWNR
ncbi:MAG: hypothetical protein ACHQQS_07285 [Thermoanaerobaculales bacterium]